MTVSRELAEDVQEVLVYALRVVCGEDEERVASLRAALQCRACNGDGSRQARHARGGRALTSALAAATVLALEDETFEHVFLNPCFARLHPNSAEVHVRTSQILAERASRFAFRLPDVWERQSRAFLDLARRHRTLDRDGLLVLQTSMAPLFCCSLAAGPALAAPWFALWNDAQRLGLGGHASLRLHLGAIGSFAGQPELQVQSLLDPALESPLLCAGLCLVRNDRTDHLYDCIASCMRGDQLRPRQCLHLTRPQSTVVRLAEYVRSCMRNPRHFHNAALVMNVLQWADQLRDLARTHAAEWVEHGDRLLDEMAGIEQTQILEKGRFWSVHDGLPDGPAKRRLGELWSRTTPRS